MQREWAGGRLVPAGATAELIVERGDGRVSMLSGRASRDDGSAEGATASRNRYITETFRAFFGGRVGSDFSAPHSSENRVHRQHDEEIYCGSDQDE